MHIVQEKGQEPATKPAGRAVLRRSCVQRHSKSHSVHGARRDERDEAWEWEMGALEF